MKKPLLVMSLLLTLAACTTPGERRRMERRLTKKPARGVYIEDGRLRLSTVSPR